MTALQILAALLPLLIWPVLALLGAHRMVPIRYVDSLPAGVRGRTRYGGFLVEVLRGIDHVDATIAHELLHVWQRWITCLVGHALLVRFSPRYRRWTEIVAYAASIKSGRPKHEVVATVAELFSMTPEAAWRALKKHM